VVITVGPYSFSPTDVRKTLHHASDLLELHGASTARGERVGAALAGVDPLRADIDELSAVLGAVWPELLGARDDRALPERVTGRVDRLSASGGGVPKLPVDRVQVGFGGVVGDRQASRVHHGRPWQALCIWSSEVIAALAADGHPIAAGAAGENVTVGALPWGAVLPGVQLRVGSVLCQVMAFAVPCKQNAQWFDDRDFQRIHHSNGPISRVYALVLEPGAIAVGDDVVLEPD
jgi:MOSC domain-containing protein YiiM